MAALPGGRGLLLSVPVLACAVLGSVLEGIPEPVRFGPLRFPIAGDLGAPLPGVIVVAPWRSIGFR